MLPVLGQKLGQEDLPDPLVPQIHQYTRCPDCKELVKSQIAPGRPLNPLGDDTILPHMTQSHAVSHSCERYMNVETHLCRI